MEHRTNANLNYLRSILLLFNYPRELWIVISCECRWRSIEIEQYAKFKLSAAKNRFSDKNSQMFGAIRRRRFDWFQTVKYVGIQHGIRANSYSNELNASRSFVTSSTNCGYFTFQNHVQFSGYLMIIAWHQVATLIGKMMVMQKIYICWLRK